MTMRVLFVLCAALALTLGVATATAGNGHGKGKGGNSAAAKACQKGGWKNWVWTDQTPFKNSGACVSYAAHGGVLTAPKTQSQLDCEASRRRVLDRPDDRPIGFGRRHLLVVMSRTDCPRGPPQR